MGSNIAMQFQWRGIAADGMRLDVPDDAFGTIVAMQVWRFGEEKICRRGSDDRRFSRTRKVIL